MNQPRRYNRIVIGSHMILHGYGHWLPNDPRGSGSQEVRKASLAALGDVHVGRRREQPARAELKAFYRQAAPRLDFPPIWLDDAKRQAVAGAFADVVRQNRYTAWACAILRNHAHLCLRRHRDDPETVWRYLAEASAAALRSMPGVEPNHPIWSNRPYKVFLKSPDDARRVVAYINENPAKERLAPQSWSFVSTYDDWPQQHTIAPPQH